MLLHQNPHQCPAVTFSSSYGSQATGPANTWLLQGGLGYFFLNIFYKTTTKSTLQGLSSSTE